MADRRGPSLFRERDLKAAIRATRAAGEEAFSVEIARDGCIRVIVSSKPATALSDEARNPWDESRA